MTRINEEGGGVATVAPGAATPANTIGMGNPVLPDGDQVGSEPYTAKAQVERVKKRKKKKSIAEIVESIFNQSDLNNDQNLFDVSFKSAMKKLDIEQIYQILQVYGTPTNSLNWGDFFIELFKNPLGIFIKIGKLGKDGHSSIREFSFSLKSGGRVVARDPRSYMIKNHDDTINDICKHKVIKSSKIEANKLVKQIIDVYGIQSNKCKTIS